MKYRRLVFKTRTAGAVLASLSLVLGLGSVVRAEVVEAPAKPGEIIIKVDEAMSASEVDALAKGVGCVVAKPLAYSPGFYLLRQIGRAVPQPKRIGRADAIGYVPDASLIAAVEALRAKPGVLADPNYLMTKADAPTKAGSPSSSPIKFRKTRDVAPPSTNAFSPNDPYYVRRQMWGLDLIRMPEAYAIQSSVRTSPVVVEVIDTGIDIASPDLIPNLYTTSQNFTDPTPNNNVRDYDGHGTHVSGTVAAATNNGSGVASVAGYNGGGVNVKVIAGKVLDSRTTGGGTQANTLVALLEAVDYGTAQKVDVMNMSLGFPGFAGRPVTQFPQTALDSFNKAYAAGVTICVAAGNDIRETTTGFPADIPGVIKVSAVNRQGTLTSYSSTGGQIAIAAPGGDGIEGGDDAIWSTWTSYLGSIDAPTVTNYWSINGTSMATPHVAGVAALLVSNGAVVSGTAGNNVIIKNIIQSSAAPIAGEVPNPAGGNKYGAGLLDAYSAILPYANPPFTVTVPGSVLASAQAGVSSVTALNSGDVPFIDRGQTYSSVQAPIVIQARGVSRKAATDIVTVEIQTATTPSTTLKTYSSTDTTPNGIVIPTLPTGAPKGTALAVQVPPPGGTPITIPDGRYRAVVKFNGTVVGIVFFEKVSRSQPQGRVLFSTPFQVRQVDANTPEQTLFGPGTVFSLARYNPLRLPSDFDYALFQSGGGRSDVQARFGATALNGEPLSFDTSNPTVSIAPVGLGYWLKLGSSVILNTSGSVVTNPVGVRCYASSGGWNMIGDPYPFAVSWGTVTVAANGQTYSLVDAVNARILSGALVSFPNGDYQYDVAPAGTLNPFNGYWIRVFQDCTIIIAPTGGTNGSGRAVKMSAGNDSPFANGWKVRLAASVAGDRDGQNFFGQVKSANKSRLALPKPPSGAGHAYLRFVDNSVGAGRATAAGVTNSGPMAYDLRPSVSGSDGTSRESWTAEVSTDKPNTDVVLTWDGLGTAPRRAGLYLTDTATGRKVSLRDRSSYTYKSGEAGSTRSFLVTMEPTFTGGPLAITNLSVSSFGKAVGGGLAIRFATTRDADVTGIIRTLNGKVVGVLSGASRAAASTNTTLHWTGRAQNGAALPAGAYQLEVTVRDADGNTATAKQTVQSLR